MKRIFIHYGSEEFIPSEWNEPTVGLKALVNKPEGGLWASPLYSKHSWKQWIGKSEHFSLGNLKKSFRFTLEKGSRVLVIDSEESVPEKYLTTNSFISERHILDFNKIIEDYDAVFLTEKGEKETRWSSGLCLYGWDCESLLVLNKNIIKILQ